MNIQNAKEVGISIGRGLLVAIILTVAAMAVLAVIIMLVTISDSAIFVINQLVKIACIFVGARLAVGAGGRRGFALGLAVGLIYVALGYAAFAALDSGPTSAGLIVGEMAMGAAAGAISGAITANMRPSKKAGRMVGRNSRPCT